MKGRNKKSGVTKDNNGLNLLYQPIVEPAKNLLVGYECLLRIYDLELGVLTPDMFMPVTQKDIRLIKRLEDWSIGEVLKISRRPACRDLSILVLNICTKHFLDDDFIGATVRLVEKSGYKPDNVYFELNANELQEQREKAAGIIAALKNLGIKVAFYGFVAPQDGGAAGFKPDLIKIPLDAVKNFMADKNARNYIKVVAIYGEQRNIEVVALGVETKEQEEALFKLGVRKMQGYLYSEPLTLIEN